MSAFLKIPFTLILGLIAYFLFKKTSRVFFEGLKKKASRLSQEQRIDTLRTLLQSVVSIVLFIIIILMVLKDLGYDITPILTGAGILGLAISFGAQSLVKDIISGFFIILENQYNVGDLIQIAGNTGKVSKINLRTTVLKNESGDTVHVPNSQIKEVVVLKEKK